MDFLTKVECAAWLQERDIFPLPHGKPLLPNVGYLQFKLPSLREVRREFTHKIFSAWDCKTSGLLAITDWGYDEEYEEDPSDAFRKCAR